MLDFQLGSWRDYATLGEVVTLWAIASIAIIGSCEVVQAVRGRPAPPGVYATILLLSMLILVLAATGCVSHRPTRYTEHGGRIEFYNARHDLIYCADGPNTSSCIVPTLVRHHPEMFEQEDLVEKELARRGL